MSVNSVADLVEALRQYRLLDPGQLQGLPGGVPEPRDVARELLRRGWLTAYQVNQLFRGRGDELLLGSYVLLEKLGEGGMGQVFKARHDLLGRVVAVKVIRKDRLAGPDAVRRFRQEVRAAAQLSHPNLVLAYDADEVRGMHFLVMEYVEGTDLARLVERSGRLPVAQACDYARQAALGLQHVHERGMVHRDVKPSNLLLSQPGREGQSGLVKLLDLGLARLGAGPGGERSSTLTEEGMVMGTLDYLAPEQAKDAHAVDIRADLYSLGCTLYHLLAGQPPFDRGARLEKLFNHQWGEAVPVERRRPDVPPRVAAVVRRLMAKRPEDRYQTPAELAVALDDPDLLAPAPAVPPTVIRPAEPPAAQTQGPERPTFAGLTAGGAAPVQVGRRVRRRRLLAAGAGLLLLAGLLAWLLRTLPPGEAGPVGGGDEGPPRAAAPGASPLDRLKADDIPKEDRFDWQPKELVAVLGEHRLRHWDGTGAVAFSPDGKTLATTGKDNLIRLWDPETGQEKGVLKGHRAWPLCLAYSADGKLLASGDAGGQIKLWDTAAAKEAAASWDGKQGQVYSLAFSPDGETLVSGGIDGAAGLVRFWDVASRREAAAALKGFHVAAYAPDGKTLGLVSTDGGSEGWELRLWDVKDRKERQTLGKVGACYSIAFSSDSKLVASAGSWAAPLRLWDLGAGKELKIASPYSPQGVAFAPRAGGALLAASGQSGEVYLFDTADNNKQVATFAAHQMYGGGGTSVAFSPDGKRLASRGHDGTVRLWDVAKKAEYAPLRGHRHPVISVAFAPDGTSLASAGWDAWLWRLKDGRFREGSPLPPASENGQVVDVHGLAFSPDGRTLVGGRFGGTQEVLAWDTATTKRRLSVKGHRGNVAAVAYAPDGKTFATGSVYYNDPSAAVEVRVWDAVTGEEQLSLALPGGEGAVSLAYSPDGKRLAAACLGGKARVWDLASRDVQVLPRRAAAAAFSPDGKQLALTNTDAGAPVALWALAGKESRETDVLKEHTDLVTGAAYSPDGKWLASSGRDGRVILWRRGTKTTKDREWQLPGPVHAVAFAADSRHLATGNGNGTVYVLRLAPPPDRKESGQE
jgi:WD40 repeat protein/tRNA A-37 threonylcarbamoyl transferase component Bud32